MANIIRSKDISIPEKLALMADDAKYDVADSDSAYLDLSAVNSIKSKQALPKVPKVFLSNDCIFNCAYCGCRNTSDERRRYCNNPRELAALAVEQAAKHGHGIFVTSAIHRNANYTEELIVETLKSIRHDFGYKGYVHAKVMPGTDPLLIKQAGTYANRLSVNIEVAKSEGYEMIAKQKNKSNILTPMKQISDMIAASQAEKSPWNTKFATSQTTQLMAGGANEDDRTILTLSKALYKKYNLKRVYYTPFQYKYPAKGYDLALVSTPSWRMHRLYQADRLMELYGFTPDEITPETHTGLDYALDPKASWALRNLHLFPIELNKAEYETLLRIPGIGVTYAKRIIEARRLCKISYELLKKIGIPLKKSKHFLTCDGKYTGNASLQEEKMRKLLVPGSAFEAPQNEQLSFDVFD